MERICVVGCSGGGKSTLSASIAQKLEIPRLELDSVYHQAGWQSLSTEEFRARVELFTRNAAWVTDGNYISEIGDITWGRADTVIWLDTSRLRATARVIRRTFGRLVTRKELWNGNRERWRMALSRDPETSIVVWAWKMHGKYAEPYQTAMDNPRWRHLRFIRLSTPREMKAFLQSLPTQSKSHG